MLLDEPTSSIPTEIFIQGFVTLSWEEKYYLQEQKLE